MNEQNKNNEEYINFAKSYLKKLAFNSIKKITNDENLQLNSEIVNKYGNKIKIEDEITKFVEFLGDDLIKDIDNITNNIDDYKLKELDKSLKNEENISIEQAEQLKKDTEKLETNTINKINNSNLEENTKKNFIDITKSIFSDLKEKLNSVINKFKIKEQEKVIDNSISLDNEIKFELLNLKEISPSILEKLSYDNDISTLRKVTAHKNTDSSTLENIFSKTNDFKVLENLLNNDKTPTKVINELAQNEDRDISLMALKHKNVSEKILLKNAKTEDKEIINNILKNKNVSEKVLQNIVTYNIRNEEILKKVINHSNCNENLNDFINEKLASKQKSKKISIKDKVKEKQEIVNKNKQEKNNNQTMSKEKNVVRS